MHLIRCGCQFQTFYSEMTLTFPLSNFASSDPSSPAFAVPDIGANFIILKWSKSPGEVTLYEIDYSPVSSTGVIPPIQVPSTSLPQSTFGGLSPSTDYTFTIKAVSRQTFVAASGVQTVEKESDDVTTVYRTRKSEFTECLFLALVWSATKSTFDNNFFSLEDEQSILIENVESLTNGSFQNQHHSKRDIHMVPQTSLSYTPNMQNFKSYSNLFFFQTSSPTTPSQYSSN